MLSRPSRFRRRTKQRQDFLSHIEQLESRVLLSASSFMISDTQAVEGNSGVTEMTFTVSRYNDANDYSQAESVAYFTEPISNEPFAATSGQFDSAVDDYVNVIRGTATFAPGEMTTQITVQVYGDQREELNEGFRVRLSPRTEFALPDQVIFGRSLAFGANLSNIVNDHPTVLLYATEPATQVLVYVNQNGPGEPPQLSLFATLPTPTPNTLIRKAEAVDFNGDGRPDIVVADQNGLFIYRQVVDAGSGLATGFELTYTYSAAPGTELSDFTTGDFTNNGIPDLVIAERSASQVTFLVNETPTGATEFTFAPAQTLTASPSPGLSRIRLAKANYSGMTLVALVSPEGANSTLTIASIVGNSNSSIIDFNGGGGLSVAIGFDGEFTRADSIQLNLKAFDLEVGDLSGDGLDDIVISTEEGPDNVVLRIFDNVTAVNHPALEFVAAASPFTIGHNPGSPLQTGGDVELADFNHDGRVDGGVNVDLLGLELFERSPDITTQMLPYGGSIDGDYLFGDLDGDGAVDLLLANSNVDLVWQRNITSSTLQGQQLVAFGTIIDDDHPQVQLSVSQSLILAGDYGDQSRTTVRAELTNGQLLTHDLSVQLVLDPASTAYGDIPNWPDFVIENGVNALNLVIPAGASYAEVEFTALSDAAGQTEPDETVILNVAPTLDYVLDGSGTFTITIVSIPEVQLVIANNVVTEGGANLFQVMALASKPMLEDTVISVDFVLGQSSATMQDVLSSGFNRIHIAAGQSVGILTLGIGDDAIPEITEYATYRLGEVHQGQVRLAENNSVTVTFVDNDPFPEDPVDGSVPSVLLSLSRNSITAGASTNLSSTRIRAELIAGQVLANDLHVSFNIDPASTATRSSQNQPGDYVLPSLDLVILAGSLFTELVLTAQPDALGPTEPDETVILNPLTTSAYVIANSGSLTVTIASIPEIRLAISNDLVTEGGSDLVRLIAYSNRPMVVDTEVIVGLLPADSTALASDFPLSGIGLIQIAAGQTSGMVGLAVTEDMLFEPTEYASFGLILVYQGLARLANSNHVVATIRDNEPLPVVNVRSVLSDGTFGSSDPSVPENGGAIDVVAVIDTPLATNLVVTVTRSGSLGTTEYATTYPNPGSAEQFPALVIPAGETRSRVLRIQSVNDTLVEPNETVALAAVAIPGNYSVGGRGPVTLTVLDDDLLPPQVSIQRSAVSVSENNGVAGFLVTLDRPAASTVTVQLGFSGTAQGTDYTALSTVVIAAGQTSGLAWVKGTDDVSAESDETVIATITSITGPAQIAGGPASITILDDDFSKVARLIYQTIPIDGNLPERGGRGVVTVLLDGPTAYPVVIRLGFSGTATLATDYTASGATLTIPVGGVVASIDLLTIADQFVEVAESITVTIVSIDSLPDGRVVAVPATQLRSATVFIQNDQRPLLVPSQTTPVSVDEDQFTVRSFRVFDATSLLSPTHFSVVSSNPALIASADVVISGRSLDSKDLDQYNQQFTVRPRLNQHGTAEITIRATNSYGTAEMTIQVIVNPVNDPPGIIGGAGSQPFEMAVDEDVPNIQNYGISITALLEGRGNPTRANSLQWADIDGEPSLRGIAITSADRTNGDWQFTTDGGEHWRSLKEFYKLYPNGWDVAYNHALLLAADAQEFVRIRYVPHSDYHGYSIENGIQIVAWDQTYGTTGSYVNISSLSPVAATAFGGGAQVQVEVFSTSDFPPVILQGNAPFTLPPIPEHRNNQPITEFTVADLVAAIHRTGGHFYDEDIAQPGITISVDANSTYYGVWEYTTGTDWNPVPIDSNPNGQLFLAASSNNRVRFNARIDPRNYTITHPLGHSDNPLPALFIRAWDYSAGDSGYSRTPASGSKLAQSVSVERAHISVEIVKYNNPPEIGFMTDVVIDNDLFDDDGIAVSEIYHEYWRASGLYLNFNEIGPGSYLEEMDPDNFWFDIGLGLRAADNRGNWDISFNGSGGWLTIPTFLLGPGKMHPLPFDARLRFVSPLANDDFRSEFAVASIGFHDGGRNMVDGNLSPGLSISSGTFRILSRNSFDLTGAEQGTNHEAISASDVTTQASLAAQWWAAAGLNQVQTGFLQSALYSVNDQSTGVLGTAGSYDVTLDSRGAGIGWFIDPTPFLDEEFALGTDGLLHAIPGGLADGKYDLLSVLAHEQGHLLGLPDLDGVDGPGSLMTGLIAPGVRRKPSDVELDALFELLAEPPPELFAPTERDS